MREVGYSYGATTMKRDFLDLRHAVMYLQDTIIRLNGEPIYVKNVVEGKKKNSKYVLKYFFLGSEDKKPHTVNMGHKHLDMTPVQLGWLAVDKDSIYNCSYISRMPNRTWHVGLCLINCVVSNLPVADNHLDPKADQRSFIFSKELRNTILGLYPKVKDAIPLSDERGVSISRRFALFRGNVYYKYMPTPVGTIKDEQIILNDHSSFLKEVLEEDVHAQDH